MMNFALIARKFALKTRNVVLIMMNFTGETLVLVGGKSPPTFWTWDAGTKLIKNKASGRCIGR